MKTATVRARVEPELKVEVESVLAQLGLSVSEAIEGFPVFDEDVARLSAYGYGHINI